MRRYNLTSPQSPPLEIGPQVFQRISGITLIQKSTVNKPTTSPVTNRGIQCLSYKISIRPGRIKPLLHGRNPEKNGVGKVIFFCDFFREGIRQKAWPCMGRSNEVKTGDEEHIVENGPIQIV